MTQTDFGILKTIGIEVFNDEITIKRKSEGILNIQFQEIEKIELIRTEMKDSSGFFRYLLQMSVNLWGNHAQGAPSRLYKLSIQMKDGSRMQELKQDFDLISVSKKINQLNKHIESVT